MPRLINRKAVALERASRNGGIDPAKIAPATLQRLLRAGLVDVIGRVVLANERGLRASEDYERVCPPLRKRAGIARAFAAVTKGELRLLEKLEDGAKLAVHNLDRGACERAFSRGLVYVQRDLLRNEERVCISRRGERCLAKLREM